MRWQITEQISARKFTNADAAAVFAVVDSNRAYLREWMPWLDQTTSVAETERFISIAEDGYINGTNLILGLWNSDSQYMGVISFNKICGANAEIGYWVSEDYQGKGVIRRALKLLIKYGFQHLNLSTINILCAVNNLKSRAVAQNLGFIQVKTIPNNEWLYDHYVDHAVYVLSR